MARRDTDPTGMAGEFLVMERLYRLGHQPALTLGRAKSIDILTRSPSGVIYEVSVKAVCGGGKWGVASEATPRSSSRVYVLLRYSSFDDIDSTPEAFVVPSRAVDNLKEPWFTGFAVYYIPKSKGRRLEEYRDAWRKYLP